MKLTTWADLAAAWVPAVTDEAKRNQLVRSIATQWLQKDPQAAQAWLARLTSP